MRALDTAALLDAWERGLRLPLPHKVMLVLAAVQADASEAELSAMTLGARDALLFDLRERLFGTELATVSACPQCDERLEAAFSLSDIRAPHVDAGIGEHQVVSGALQIRFRLPSTADVLAIPAGSDAAAARDILIGRCIIEARDEAGNPVALQALPPAAIPEISALMARADPQAVVDLALTCPACNHAFSAAFDIASFLMAELHAWAQRLIADVGVLARAFGWREGDILALGPTRRQLYLELATR